MSGAQLVGPNPGGCYLSLPGEVRMSAGCEAELMGADPLARRFWNSQWSAPFYRCSGACSWIVLHATNHLLPKSDTQWVKSASADTRADTSQTCFPARPCPPD